MKKQINYLIILILLIVISGCTSKKKKWENTKQINTPLAYEDYLKKYPQSAYSDSAQIFLEKLCFKQAQYADSIPSYEDFLTKYPQSIYADSVQILLEKLCYRQAQATNTINAYKEFIETYPSSQLVPQAKDKLINAEWQATKRSYSINILKEFIKKYPNNKFAEMAKAKIRNIELLKGCPFELIIGEPIKLRNYKAGDSYTIDIGESNLKSLKSGGWLMQGIGGKLLNIKQKMSGKYNLQIYWIDQPFEISHNGKLLAFFKNTAEYWEMLNE